MATLHEPTLPIIFSTPAYAFESRAPLYAERAVASAYNLRAPSGKILLSVRSRTQNFICAVSFYDMWVGLF